MADKNDFSEVIAGVLIELHRKAAQVSLSKGGSLNQLVAEALEKCLENTP